MYKHYQIFFSLQQLAVTYILVAVISTSYRFQLKSYLPIAAKPLETLASRFKPPLSQTGFNLESVSAYGLHIEIDYHK